MQPLFSFAFLFSVAVALGAQDSDLTKEPWRGDPSKPKLCGFKLGLFLFLANAFFFPFLLLYLLGLVPCTPRPSWVLRVSLGAWALRG